MWKQLLFLAAVAANYKAVPFAYFVRFYALVFRNLIVPLRKYRRTRQNTFGISGAHKLDIFRAVAYTSYAAPLEIDMYLHKSNSTYFVDLDLARTKFVCQVFQKLFLSNYENERGDFAKRSISNFPYVPVGTVKCVFKHEIKAFQRYTIVLSVLAWDDKWLYVLLKFESKGKLCALGVTKYVFKRGRRTIKPRDFIEICGLYNKEAEAINTNNYPLVAHLERSDGLEEIAARMDA